MTLQVEGKLGFIFILAENEKFDLHIETYS